jgi:hypothetical protein
LNILQTAVTRKLVKKGLIAGQWGVPHKKKGITLLILF